MTSDVVDTVRRALEPHRHVHLALLFGSTARGTARDDSDVDLAVDAPGVDLLGLARDLSLALGREVHVVDLTEPDPGYPLLAAIVRDGVLVAEHDRGAHARWRTRAILRVETDRPWFERMREAYLARLATGATSHG